MALSELVLDKGDWSYDLSFLEMEARAQFGAAYFDSVPVERQGDMMGYISASRKMRAYDLQEQKREMERMRRSVKVGSPAGSRKRRGR